MTVTNFLSAFVRGGNGTETGFGIDVERSGTGEYLISYEEDFFESTPAVILTPVQTDPSWKTSNVLRAVVMSCTETGCKVQTSKGGDLADVDFTILAIRNVSYQPEDDDTSVPHVAVGEANEDGGWEVPDTATNAIYPSTGKFQWYIETARFETTPGQPFPVLIQARTSNEAVSTELREFDDVDSTHSDVRGASFTKGIATNYVTKRIQWVMSNETSFETQYTGSDGNDHYASYCAGVVRVGSGGQTSGDGWKAYDLGANRILVTLRPSAYSSQFGKPAVRVVGSGEDQAVITAISNSPSQQAFVVRIEKGGSSYPPFCFIWAGSYIHS